MLFDLSFNFALASATVNVGSPAMRSCSACNTFERSSKIRSLFFERFNAHDYYVSFSIFHNADRFLRLLRKLEKIKSKPSSGRLQ